jgi:predicted dehydrogenase
MRVGLIGLGREALNTYLPVLSRIPAAKISGSDIKLSRTGRLSANGVSIPIYDTVLEMIARHQPELLIVCASPNSHVALMKQACSASISTVCEKPVLATTEELSRLRGKFIERNLQLRLVNNWKYSPQFRHFMRLLNLVPRDREATCDLSISFNRPNLERPGWRAEEGNGGLTWEYGWHAIYLMLAIYECVYGDVRKEQIRLVIHDRVISSDTAKCEFRYGKMRVILSINRAAQTRTTRIKYSVERFTMLADEEDVVLTERSRIRLRRSFPNSPLSSQDSRKIWLSSMIGEGLLIAKTAAQSCDEGEECIRVLSQIQPLPSEPQRSSEALDTVRQREG